MAKQDRGAPVRPPWLPDEERRGGARLFPRRRKSDAAADATDAAPAKAVPAKPEPAKAPPAKTERETPVMADAVSTLSSSEDEKPDETTKKSDASKYYVPVRKEPVHNETVDLKASTPDLSREVDDVPAERIVAPPELRPPDPSPETTPAPQPIPVVESEWSRPSPAPADDVVPESIQPDLSTDLWSPPAPPAPEPVQTAPANTAEFVLPVQPEQAPRRRGREADPSSRFSVLEAKIRQAGLDESIRGGGHRAAAEPSYPQAADEPDTTSAPSPASAPIVEPEEIKADSSPQTFTLAADRESDLDITGAFVPQTAVPAPVHTAEAQTPQHTSATEEAPSAGEVDEIEARAAALLQRIEAKRAELDRDLASFEVPAPAATTTELSATPEPPDNAERAAEPEAVPAPVDVASVIDEITPVIDESAQQPVIDTAEAASPVASTPPDEQVHLEEEEEVATGQAQVEEMPAEAQADEVLPADTPGTDASAQANPVAAKAEPESAEPNTGPDPAADDAVPDIDTAPDNAAAVHDVDRPEQPSAVDGGNAAEPQQPSERRSAPLPWQIATPPPVDAPPQPAYYVPQAPIPAPPPPDWAAPQPAAQWPQAVPGQYPGPQTHGGQPVPPPPSGAQGQWQWVAAPAPAPAQPPTTPPLPPQAPPAHYAAPPASAESSPPPAGYVPPPPPTAPPRNYQPPQAYRLPPSLDEAEIINRGRYAPRSGWRRAVHMATGGHVNPGDSRKDREYDDLLASIRQPILGDYRIAVLSIKGGVGKTTTTLGLGSAFATVRTDRIIAVDANPDRGTLAERVRDQSTHSTVRDLLNDQHINSYADVRNHTRMATSRLEVLASEQDPAVSEAFGEVDYRHTVDILQRYYNIILTDCGTGIMHSAMSGVLDLAHTIVLVSSPAMDAARSASATLDWLTQHGYSGLVREAHVVLSASRPGSAGIKLDKVYEHFEARCKSIHMIPFDPHLAEGADVDFNLLNPDTNEAYLELAGDIAENFPRLRARDELQR